MDDIDPNTAPADKDWDLYWRGMHQGAAPAIGGANHPGFEQFWRDFFSQLNREPGRTSIVDIGSGDGAVAAFAFAMLGTESVDVTCVDISSHAIERLKVRFPAVHGIAADAQDIPLETASFDIVTSQFGVEYAGSGAFGEAARLVAPGGRIAMLIHKHAGSIYRECATSVEAVKKLKRCKFIPRSIEMFRAGFAARRGADDGPYNAAVQRLLPAFRDLERIMQQYGRHVAGDTLLRLSQDVDRIHGSMQDYDPDEILQWLSAMDNGLDSYAGTMGSMRDAALNEPQFREICNNLQSAGFSLQQADALTSDDLDLPLSWSLIAHR
jgi:SAM-dependent methyltransferase